MQTLYQSLKTPPLPRVQLCPSWTYSSCDLRCPFLLNWLITYLASKSISTWEQIHCMFSDNLYGSIWYHMNRLNVFSDSLPDNTSLQVHFFSPWTDFLWSQFQAELAYCTHCKEISSSMDRSLMCSQIYFLAKFVSHVL